MSQILVRGLSEEAVGQLKRRAKRHGRSLQAEVRSILEEEARRGTTAVNRTRLGELLRAADEIRERTGQRTDSVEILRQVRDSEG
jgi:plasmid stability protein